MFGTCIPGNIYHCNTPFPYWVHVLFVSVYQCLLLTVFTSLFYSFFLIQCPFSLPLFLPPSLSLFPLSLFLIYCISSARGGWRRLHFLRKRAHKIAFSYHWAAGKVHSQASWAWIDIICTSSFELASYSSKLGELEMLLLDAFSIKCPLFQGFIFASFPVAILFSPAPTVLKALD